MAAALVLLASAKLHLRIPAAETAYDGEVQAKLDQAELIILEYLDTSVDPLWVSPATAPGAVTAAILLMLTDLYEHRGDDTSEVTEKTWQAIERLLVRSRNAAIA